MKNERVPGTQKRSKKRGWAGKEGDGQRKRAVTKSGKIGEGDSPIESGRKQSDLVDGMQG